MRFYAGFVLLFLIAGCQSTPSVTAEHQSTLLRQSIIAKHRQWQANGRISLSSPQQNITGALDWLQSGTDYRVGLTAALGQRALLIEQNAELASLQIRGDEKVTGSSAEDLLLQRMGIRVPFAQLSYWIRGLPGSIGTAQYDRFGRLHTIKYRDADGRDWRARINQFLRVEDIDLPRIIEVTDGEHKIRVVLSNWNLGEPALVDPAKPDQQTPGRLSIPGVSA